MRPLGTVELTSSGKWRGRYWITDDLGRRRRVSKTLHATAKKAAVHELNQLVTRDGRRVVHLGTLDAAIATYLDLDLPRAAGPGHVVNRRSLWKNHVQEHAIAERTLEDIDPIYVELFYDHLSDKGLSGQSVRHVAYLISGAYQSSLRRGTYVGVNPIDHAAKPALAKKDIVPPSPGDMAELLFAASNSGTTHFDLFVRIAAVTGARRGEIAALRWSRVDWSSGMIRFDSSLEVADGVVLVKGLKSKKGSKPPPPKFCHVDDDTLIQLAQARPEGAAGEDDRFVFAAAPDGLLPRSPAVFSTAWIRLREQVGFQSVRLHDVRHYVAAMLLATRPAQEVQKQLGHLRLSTTIDTYGHVLETPTGVGDEMAALLRPDQVKNRGV